MHVPTHLLAGWCLGNCFRLTARERLLCMIAGAAPDLDGVGRVVSEELYWDWHHVLGHNWLFTVVVGAVMAGWSTNRVRAFCAYVVAGHSHFLMDLVGSGPEWGMHYWWPFAGGVIEYEHAWPLFSWQNVVAAAVLMGWTLWIAVRHGRTPVEVITPELDRRWVAALRGWVRRERKEVAAAADV